MNKLLKKNFLRKTLFPLKYLFSVIITLLASVVAKDFGFFVVGLIELSFIFLTSNQLLRLQRIIGQIFNSVLILFYNIQMLVLFFSTSFVTLIMLDNIASWQALQGRALGYGLGIVFLLLFSFLPISYIELQLQKDYKIFKWNVVALFAILNVMCLEVIALNIFKLNNSPSIAVYFLIQEKIEYEQLKEASREQSEQLRARFEKSEVSSFVKKPTNLVEKPNVILIFAEGMSQRIIDDSRNITPTVKEYQGRSINFKNYYNHTFATYRGIIGQLFSGYQLENLDQNHLISLPMILRNQGYQTSFINTESENKDFSKYLNSLGFDKIIDSPVTKGERLSFDKEAYNELFNQISSQSKSGNPFFVSMYTFGTHVGMDSTDKKYGDGKDRVLNRFYNMDQQFKSFMTKFQESGLANNTIIIFTTDHATYVDDEYVRVFPKEERAQGNIDTVPFFIYYKGAESQTIDVNGRNSINLAPTILDLLDYSQKNYFLGNSLFSDEESSPELSTIFSSELDLKTTKDSRITYIADEDIEQVKSVINEYYKAAKSNPD